MIKNLWGDIPTGENIRTPATIVNEQITVLNKATQGLLTGALQTVQNGDNFEHHFFVIAPSLNQYAAKLLVLSHGFDLYPCVMTTPLIPGSSSVRVPSEESFCVRLESILRHPKTRNLISGLLAQIRSNPASG